MTQHVYKLEDKEVSFDELVKLGSRVRLEGVDGDEEADTVTYWYTRHCSFCGAYASRCHQDQDDGSTICAVSGEAVR